MPTLRKPRSGHPFSFRPTENIMSEKIPALCEWWGEERARVISRCLQMSWDHIDRMKPDGVQGAKSNPLNYRPSTFEEDVIIPELMSRMVTDRSTAMCQAIEFAYNQEVVRRGNR